VGDCLFDAITYLLKYSISSIMIWKNNMSHLQECLGLDTLKVFECCRRGVKFEFLHDLHHGNANEKKKFRKCPFQH
jgi:hypothetical protein